MAFADFYGFIKKTGKKEEYKACECRPRKLHNQTPYGVFRREADFFGFETSHFEHVR